MTNYYIDVSDELADRLSGVPSEEIVSALEEVAAAHEEQEDSDELAQYGSLAELREDSELSPAERKRRELKWQRTVGRRTRKP